MRAKRIAAFALGVLSLTACGGGGRSGFSSGGMLPAPAFPALSGSAAGTVQFSVTIPVRGRRSRYISPNTQSMSVAVNGGKPQAIGLTPATNPNCSGGKRKPIVCKNLTVKAGGGKDTFAFELYEQALVNGALPAGATVLSRYTTPRIEIAAGTTNNLGVFTLNPVIGSLALTVGGAGFEFTPGTPSSNVAVDLIAKDPSGATIVAPGEYADSAGKLTPVKIATTLTKPPFDAVFTFTVNGVTTGSSAIVKGPADKITVSYSGLIVPGASFELDGGAVKTGVPVKTQKGAPLVTAACAQTYDLCANGTRSSNGSVQFANLEDTATLTPSEPGWTGKFGHEFTLSSDTCNMADDPAAGGDWATFSPKKGQSGATFTITAKSASSNASLPATCNAVLADGGGNTVTMDVSVTTTPVGVNTRRAPAVRVMARHFIFGERRANGSLQFRILIPKRKNRDPHFVSPATQGMTLKFTGGPTKLSAIVGLTPSSPGCSYTLAGTLCTYDAILLAGNYTASITTYDAVTCAHGSCSIPRSANALSTAQSVAVDVVAGLINQTNVTMSGIPAALGLIPANSMSVPQGYFTPSIHLVGMGAHPFLVEALDADGNAIVGPGAPTLAVSAPPSAGFTVTTPTAAAPNSTTLTVTSLTAGGNVTISASYPPALTNVCSLAVCSAQIKAVPVEMLLAGNNTHQVVAGYQVSFASPVLTLAIGGNVLGVGADNLGNVYVLTDASGGELLVFPSGDSKPSRAIRLAQAPCCLAVDPSNGNAFVGYTAAASRVDLFVRGSKGATQVATATLTGGLAIDAAKNLVLGGATVQYEPAPYTNGTAAGVNAGSGSCTNATTPKVLAADASGDLFVGNTGAICEWTGASGGYTSAPTLYTNNHTSAVTAIAIGSSDLFGVNGTAALEWPPASAAITPFAWIQPGTSAAADANGEIYFGTTNGTVQSILSGGQLSMTYSQGGGTTSEVYIEP
ncbi:MAG: hypothetical protein JO199_13730 [Candidatus Eremiobacteraeota bacterium]|nr:hypothetical protein [Candidatus Eremiobacteraeota bacterium]